MIKCINHIRKSQNLSTIHSLRVFFLPILKILYLDVADALLESNIDKKVLGNTPIVSSIYNLYKSSVSISDRMFLKKILGFLSELDRIEKEKISSFYKKIKTEEKFKKNVGDKLMFIVDKCEDDEESKIVAKIFGVNIFVRKLTMRTF